MELERTPMARDLDRLNEQVKAKLEELNNAPFTATERSNSRRQMFEDEEREFLSRLSIQAFCPSDIRVLVVDRGHCVRISGDGHRYSTPPEYTSKRVSGEFLPALPRTVLTESLKINWASPKRPLAAFSTSPCAGINLPGSCSSSQIMSLKSFSTQLRDQNLPNRIGRRFTVSFSVGAPRFRCSMRNSKLNPLVPFIPTHTSAAAMPAGKLTTACVRAAAILKEFPVSAWKLTLPATRSSGLILMAYFTSPSCSSQRYPTVACFSPKHSTTKLNPAGSMALLMRWSTLAAYLGF